MGDNGPGVRHESFYHGLHIVKPLYPGVYYEDLSVTRHFEVDGLAYDIVVERVDGGHYRITVGGWGGDCRKVTGAHK